VRQLLVTASVVPSLPILVTLMKEALNSSEMSVLTRATTSQKTPFFELCYQFFSKPEYQGTGT
jgi:ABC-type molybdate transport system permease subunit